jgi:4-amino-4-deoxy-L-arabinose transferase-like glycosyltransferase
MNEKPINPPDDSSAKETGKPEEPSVLDYLIQSLRNFLQSLRAQNPTKPTKPSEAPLPIDDTLPVGSPGATASAQLLSEPDVVARPDQGRRTLLMIKLPFGAFVTFGVEKNTLPAAAKVKPADSFPLPGEKLGRTVRRPFIHVTAKRSYSKLTAICSVLFAVTGFWLLFQNVPTLLHWVDWVLLFNGVFVYIFATRVGEEGEKSLWDHLTGGRFNLGVMDWQKICLAISVCLAFVAAASAGYGQMMDHPYLAIVAWLAAIILAFIGGWKNTASQPGLEIWDVVIFLGFAIAAFALRSFNLANNPNVLTGDEASSGLSAALFAQGKMNNIFMMGWFSFPSLFFFLQSIPIRFLGQNTEALRLFSALAGALTVGAVYLFGSKIFNRWAGIFAALFLLTFNYHNHFSRIGLNNIWDGLWFTVVLGLLWYGWEKENRLSFLFCGFFLGLAQYFYVTSRALLPLVALLLVILALTDRKRAGQRLADVFLMAVTCLVVMLPLMFFFIKFPLEYNAPFQRTSIFGDWMKSTVQLTGKTPIVIVLNQIYLSLQGMISLPLRGPWYEPFTPLLRPISAVLFIIGLLALLIRWKGFRTYILIIWLALIVLIGGLSENTPAAQRYVAIAPAVALTIGFGLAEVGSSLGKIRPRFTNLIFIALLAIMVVFGMDELRFYFVDYALTDQAQLGGENGLVAQRLADYLQSKDSSWQVAFFGFPRMGYYSFSTIPYLAPAFTGLDMNAAWGSPDNPLITSDHVIFVFLPEHADDLKAVQAQFPNGQLHEERYKDHTLYWLYEVPSS